MTLYDSCTTTTLLLIIMMSISVLFFQLQIYFQNAFLEVLSLRTCWLRVMVFCWCRKQESSWVKTHLGLLVSDTKNLEFELKTCTCWCSKGNFQRDNQIKVLGKMNSQALKARSYWQMTLLSCGVLESVLTVFQL